MERKLLPAYLLYNALLYCSVLAGKSIPEKIQLYERPEGITWQEATDECESDGRSLCMRKSICQQNGVLLSPKKNVVPSKGDRWVPIADEYNDWVYMGNNASRLCAKISKIEGPPSWGEKRCSNFKPKKWDKKRFQFCAAVNAFYCCAKLEKVEPLAPRNLPVYVKSAIFDGAPHYAFSLDENGADNDDQVQWRSTGRLHGDIAMFTLLSGRVKGRFESTVFFCTRPATTETGLRVTLHKASRGWCVAPWSLNFYLYTSFLPGNTEESNIMQVAYAGKGATMTARISIEEDPAFSTKFNILGPVGEDLLKYAILAEDACTSGTEELTSIRGVVHSPNYPKTFMSKASRSKVRCNWRIIAESKSIVRITFKDINLKEEKTNKSFTFPENNFVPGRRSSYNFDRNCTAGEFVEIVGYGRFCGSDLPPTFVTTTNVVDIQFRGTSISTRFSLSYEAIPPPNGLSMSKIANWTADYSWRSANQACEEKEGKRLCTAAEICRRVGRPFYGIEKGDQWAPVADEFNDWVQVGKGNVRTCGRHNKRNGPPRWGVVDGMCTTANISRPCPRREVLYCCKQSNVTMEMSAPITIDILTAKENGIIFSKYSSRYMHKRGKSAGTGIWTPEKKASGDLTSIVLYTNYQPGISRVVYFCRRALTPAIGRVDEIYSMFLQPCESTGWKLTGYAYAPDGPHENYSAAYVGIYEKWPHHTRVNSVSFPDEFQGDEGFILYTPTSDAQTRKQEVIADGRDEACKGHTSTIIAPSILESPGYPKTYQNDASCVWHIKLPDNLHKKDVMLKITIEELSLEDPVDVLSIYEVLPGVNLDKTTQTVADVVDLTKSRDYTGTVRGVTLETASSFLLVFRTDKSISDKGFRVNAGISKECGGEVTEHATLITSPDYPYHYPAGVQCIWILRAPTADYSIELRFGKFDMASTDCLEIRYIQSEIRRFCGPATTSSLALNTSVASIVFHPKPGTENRGKGFMVQVFFIANEDDEEEGSAMGPEHQCGVQTVPFSPAEIARDKVVGGNFAKPGNFPWMVLITNVKKTIMCGGSLLNERWILTAVHCFVKENYPDENTAVVTDLTSNFIVIAGRHKANKSTPGEQKFKITATYWPAGHRNQMYLAFGASGIELGFYPSLDISVARLATKAVYSPTVSPVCLPTQDTNVGEVCYVMGWGSIDVDGKIMAKALKYARVPILDNSVCNSWGAIQGLIEDEAICAGRPDGGQDFCYGDSGGPLVCRGPYGNFYVNGIVSWSRECGGVEKPGVYARVWSFYNMIAEVMNKF